MLLTRSRTRVCVCDVNSVSVDPEGEQLAVQLPDGFDEAGLTGTVHLYCPTDETADRRFELLQPFSVSTASLKKGKWNVIVSWELDGKAYMFERTIFLN